MINCSIVTRVSDNPPILITSYVLENIPPNSVVYCLDDSVFFDTPVIPGTVTYETSVGFTIDNTLDAVLLIHSPDREAVNQQTGVVMAINMSNSARSEAMLRVNIIDVNEFPPKFILPDELQHSLRFTEGEKPTNSLVGIKTLDDDNTDDENTVNFIIDGIGSDEFNITKSVDGNIIISTNLVYTYGSPLDRERIEFYQLTIVAVDSVSPIMTSNPSLQVNITIDDINDNVPQFIGNRMFVIPSGLEEGVLVGNISATDADAGENARITYSIVSSNLDAFTIESISGTLRTSSNYKTVVPTDVTNLTVMVEVMAADNGVIPLFSTFVFTFIIQHPITFTSRTYAFKVVENNSPLESVGSVSASSPALASFYYRIKKSTGDKFAINRSTGEITVQESLDREATPIYEFTVAAVYSSHPDLSSTTVVKIKVMDVNDNDPQFDKQEYMFKATASQTVAGYVTANDSDTGNNSNVTFSSLTSSTQLIVRNIGNNTAEIIIGEVEVVEGEEAALGITVVATDGGGRTSTAPVTVEGNSLYNTIIILQLCNTSAAGNSNA